MSVRVLYVAGSGRSGSTMLELLLDGVAGVVGLGQISTLWSKILPDDDPCGCGARFSRCPFWSAVGESAFGGWSELDAARLRRAQHRFARHRNLPPNLPAALRRSARGDLLALREATGRLYPALAAVSGGALLVDSSKTPAHAALLRTLPELDLRAVHLIRDPRGVAYSRSRRAATPSSSSPPPAPARSALAAGLRWVTVNLSCEAVLAGLPRRTLRYEQLVREPAATLRELAAFAGLDPKAVGTGERFALRPERGHGIGGNSLRLRPGPQPLRLDERWSEPTFATQARLVGAIAGPLDRRYRRRARRSMPGAGGAPAGAQ